MYFCSFEPFTTFLSLSASVYGFCNSCMNRSCVTLRTIDSSVKFNSLSLLCACMNSDSPDWKTWHLFLSCSRDNSRTDLCQKRVFGWSIKLTFLTYFSSVKTICYFSWIVNLLWVVMLLTPASWSGSSLDHYQHKSVILLEALFR